MIQVGHKFAMIALCGAQVEGSDKEPRRLADDVALLFEPATVFDKDWTTWLGTIASEEIKKAQLCVLATQRSDSPGVLDAENKDLCRRAEQALHGLFIAAPPHCETIRVLTGAYEHEERGPDIRETATIPAPWPPKSVARDFLTADDAESAARLGVELHARVWCTEAFDRIKRGFAALVRALCEPRGDFKHHQYVRSIEAFLKTDKGAGTRHFIHRCRTFVLDNQLNCDLLGEIYDIRCKVEHLHAFGKALRRYPETERESTAHQRLRQAAALAHNLYETLARNHELDQHFESDSAIDAFWARPDADRKSLWPRNARVDLSAIE
jgi:hypothetical protein